MYANHSGVHSHCTAGVNAAAMPSSLSGWSSGGVKTLPYSDGRRHSETLEQEGEADFSPFTRFLSYSLLCTFGHGHMINGRTSLYCSVCQEVYINNTEQIDMRSWLSAQNIIVYTSFFEIYTVLKPADKWLKPKRLGRNSQIYRDFVDLTFIIWILLATC